MKTLQVIARRNIEDNFILSFHYDFIKIIFVAHLTNPEVHRSGILSSFGNSRGGLILAIVIPKSSTRYATSSGDR
jgi:hypothetical protein